MRHLLARFLYAAHDEFKVRVVVAVVFANHQKVALCIRRTMQTVRAIKHENLEARHAKLFNQLRDFFDVGAVHRREVKAVVDVETVLRGFEHLWVKLFVRPALIHVVLAGAKVVQAAGHPAHGCSLAFTDRIFFKRGVNAAVHMRIDHAREGQAVSAVMNSLSARHVDPRGYQRHLAVRYRNICIKHHIAVWPHHADVFDQ